MNYKLKEVVIEITKKCNINCMHCGSDCKSIIDDRELSVEEWKKALLELKEMNVEKVVFSGGELTIKKEIEEIISFTADQGIKYGFITNGFFMSEKFLEVIKNKKPFAVGLSIDGLKDTHNKIRRNEKSWQNIAKKIPDLQDNNIQICAVTTINRLNYQELPKLAKWINLAGIDSWQLQLVMPSGRAKEQDDFLIDENIFKKIVKNIFTFKDVYPDLNIQTADCFGLIPVDLKGKDWQEACTAGVNSMGIGSFGNVLPCLSIRSDLKCGHVKEGIKNIWDNSKSFDFNRNFKKENVIGKCKECKYISSCRGGCASMSYSYFDHFHEAPFCYMRSFNNNILGG